MRSNFSHLANISREVAKLGQRAEKYFADDPNTSLLKLRQFGEILAQEAAARLGIPASEPPVGQFELLGQLDQTGALGSEVKQLFHGLRKAGNSASHSLAGDYKTALENLKVARQLGIWFYRTFRDPEFSPGPFIPPEPPENESASLKEEIDGLKLALSAHQASLQAAEEQAGSARQHWAEAQEEARLWETLASEAEASKEQQKTSLQQLQVQSTPTQAAALIARAQSAGRNVELDEAATRVLIDGQLRAAGWEADSQVFRYGNGTRPEPGRCLAIAEWPTASGPADYALFVGLDFLATVEAKGYTEKNLDAAWQSKANHEIAAGILGYIRQAALGDALVPFAERVDRAVQALESRHAFSPIQKQWLTRLAKQLKKNTVLDRDTLDSGPLKRDGGFRTADKIFEGRLEELLAEMNETMWTRQSGT